MASPLKAFDRRAFVPQSSVAARPEVCPQCGSPNVLILGRFQRAFRVEIRQGERQQMELDSKHVERTTAIECPRCEMGFDVLADERLAMITEVRNLRQKFAEQEGATLFTPSGLVH
jgi:DNA-directed RNA polymerase subunit RPC12/RpoP